MKTSKIVLITTKRGTKIKASGILGDQLRAIATFLTKTAERTDFSKTQLLECIDDMMCLELSERQVEMIIDAMRHFSKDDK